MPSSITVRTKVDTDRLNSILRRVGANTEQALRQVAFKVAQEAVSSMSEPKTGKLYGEHRASAPGQAPAIDTGALANSIYVATVSGNNPPAGADVTLPDPKRDTVNVGPSVWYGAVLEFGIGMAPRPFMRPAVNRVASYVDSHPEMFDEVVTG
jgi:hypothetical protein